MHIVHSLFEVLSIQWINYNKKNQFKSYAKGATNYRCKQKFLQFSLIKFSIPMLCNWFWGCSITKEDKMRVLSSLLTTFPISFLSVLEEPVISHLYLDKSWPEMWAAKIILLLLRLNCALTFYDFISSQWSWYYSREMFLCFDITRTHFSLKSSMISQLELWVQNFVFSL